MIKMLTAGMVAIAAGAAYAQTPAAPPPTAPMAGHHGMMADKVMTRDEMLGMVRNHFGKLDANHDNVIAMEEVGAAKGRWAGKGGHHQMTMREHKMGDPNTAFDRLDVNKDGSISRDEFAKGREIRVEKRIVMRDGKKMPEGEMGPGEHHMMRMEGHGPGKGRGMRMIVMADTNGDGKITQAEAEAMALKHFDQMDANHDGKVTPEERKAARPMIMQMRRTKQLS